MGFKIRTKFNNINIRVKYKMEKQSMNTTFKLNNNITGRFGSNIEDKILFVQGFVFVSENASGLQIY